MSIVGQNALLNQYVPTIYIKDLLDGQILRYDSTRRAFVNANGGGGGTGADKLGELLNVSDTVDSPSLSLANGQALVYNSFTSLWENQYIGGGPGAAGQVLTSNGAGFTPTWQTVASGGSVTSVSVVTANGVSGVVANPTTTPAITLTLGAITPTSVTTTGNIIAGGVISGSNLSGTNTGNQLIVLTGDATNSNTSTGGILTLANTGVVPGSYGSATQVPVFTVDSKGRITGVTNTAIPSGGTVTSVAASGSADITVGGSPITTSGTLTFSLSNTTVVPNTYGSATQVPVFTVDAKGRITGVTNTAITGGGTVTSVATIGNNGITVVGSPITTSGTFTLGLGAITPTSVAASGTISGSNLSGTNTGDQTITLTGDVTGSGTGSFATTLSNTGVTANTYGSATQVPQFTVDAKGRITGVTNVTITATGTVTSVSGSGGTTGLTLTGGPITTTGTLTLGGTLAIANGGTGATTAQGARNALLPTQTGNAGRFLTTDGTNVSWGIVPAGTVTTVSITSTADITGSVTTPTTTPAASLLLTTTGVTAATYGSATEVPVFTVDSKGRISSVTNTPISGGSSSPEIVVWHYSPGGSGNFTPGDVLFSQTAGVTATVTDTANCIATYAFTGKSNPPKSITFYGQNFSANTFAISGMPGPNAALANIKIAGGGTAAAPDLANGIFSAANVVTLQTTMANVGASSTIGNRAWLVVVFGF